MDVEVLLWSELVRRAGSPARARSAVADGAFRRVLRGAYVAAAVGNGPEVRSACAARVLPAGVALSGRAALWALGLDVLPRDGVLDVTTTRGRHLVRRPGLRPWTALLPENELVELPGGLLAVSAARACVDVARREHLVEAVALADAAVRSGATTTEQLATAVDGASGLRGVLRARSALPHLEPRSESQGESRLRMRLVLGGLPRPEAQVDYYDEHGSHVARADLVLAGVVLEYDGREQRLRKEVFSHDRTRQNALVGRGVELRRFTAVDVTPRNQARLCVQVRAAVAAAAGRPAPRVRRGPDTLRAPRLTPLPTRADTARADRDAA